jgi:hypothetical protein
MIILSTLRYGETAYGSASKAVLRKLDPIHHRGVRLVLGIFAENVLCENERRKHDEDRNKYIDERKPPYQITNDEPEHHQKPFFIRAAKQIDIWWKMEEKWRILPTI